MPSRRQFLKSVAGVSAGIVGLGNRTVISAAQALDASSAPKRRVVTVAGRRVKTVDVHCHCNVDVSEIVKGTILERTGGEGGPNVYRVPVGPERFATMNEQGIDVEALSINAFWYAADRDLASKLIDFQNEKLAEMCAKYPDRFVAFSSVALQFPDLAAQQMEYAYKHFGMRGAAIGESVGEDELSSRKFDPFWAKAEELQALIFMHPQASAEATGIRKRVRGPGVLGNVIGNPLETTIALSHLIFDGTLDRFPGLKLCAAHGGGYLPSYSARMDHGCLVFPDQCKGLDLKRHPSEYMKQLYFDSLVFTSEGLRHLVADTQADHLMIGTDYPFPWTSTPVDHVMSTPGLTDAEKIAILGGTACKMLGIPA